MIPFLKKLRGIFIGYFLIDSFTNVPSNLDGSFLDNTANSAISRGPLTSSQLSPNKLPIPGKSTALVLASLIFSSPK